MTSKMLNFLATIAVPCVCAGFFQVKAATATFAERLGWKADDRVVLLHVDDAGMSHASNLGTIESLEKGVATSFSIMMPCPWVPEMAKYIGEHPEVDCGLHLTLTSEWVPYRWGPLAGKPAVPGLVDEQGCLFRSVGQVTASATADEVEREIRAQIDRAEGLKIPITHLDSHMGTLFARPDYFERFLRVGVEKQIPILAVGGHMTHARKENPEAVKALGELSEKIWQAGLPVMDDLHTGTYGWEPTKKKELFSRLLQELKPGVTEILFHSCRMTEELPIITGSAESRQADMKALTDPDIKSLIARERIILTTWKELMARRKAAGGGSAR